jgi:hypothetical protein
MVAETTRARGQADENATDEQGTEATSKSAVATETAVTVANEPAQKKDSSLSEDTGEPLSTDRKIRTGRPRIPKSAAQVQSQDEQSAEFQTDEKNTAKRQDSHVDERETDSVALPATPDQVVTDQIARETTEIVEETLPVAEKTPPTSSLSTSESNQPAPQHVDSSTQTQQPHPEETASRVATRDNHSEDLSASEATSTEDLISSSSQSNPAADDSQASLQDEQAESAKTTPAEATPQAETIQVNNGQENPIQDATQTGPDQEGDGSGTPGLSNEQDQTSANPIIVEQASEQKEWSTQVSRPEDKQVSVPQDQVQDQDQDKENNNQV